MPPEAASNLIEPAEAEKPKRYSWVKERARRRRMEEASCKEFHCFGKLPAELRVMVWNYALPVHRLVELAIRPCRTGSLPNWSLESSTPVPSLLHVNRESRDLALKFYQLSFRGFLHYLPRDISDGRKIYFNFDFDTLYIGRSSIKDDVIHLGNLLVDPNERRKITHLAVDADLLAKGASAAGQVEAGVNLSMFFLKELTLVETERSHLPKDPVLVKTPGIKPYTVRKPSKVSKAFNTSTLPQFQWSPAPIVNVRYFKSETKDQNWLRNNGYSSYDNPRPIRRKDRHYSPDEYRRLHSPYRDRDDGNDRDRQEDRSRDGDYSSDDNHPPRSRHTRLLRSPYRSRDDRNDRSDRHRQEDRSRDGDYSSDDDLPPRIRHVDEKAVTSEGAKPNDRAIKRKRDDDEQDADVPTEQLRPIKRLREGGYVTRALEQGIDRTVYRDSPRRSGSSPREKDHRPALRKRYRDERGDRLHHGNHSHDSDLPLHSLRTDERDLPLRGRRTGERDRYHRDDYDGRSMSPDDRSRDSSRDRSRNRPRTHRIRPW